MSQRPCSNLIHHWTERVIYICVAASGGSYCFRGQVENLVAFQATGTFVVCLINLETRAYLNLVSFDAPKYSFQILKTIQDWLISNHNWIYRIYLYFKWQFAGNIFPFFTLLDKSNLPLAFVPPIWQRFKSRLRLFDIQPSGFQVELPLRKLLRSLFEIHIISKLRKREKETQRVGEDMCI